MIVEKFYIFICFIVLLGTSNNYFPQDDLLKNNSAKPILILPLGNSITFDSRSNDTRNIGEKAGYRASLFNLLKESGYNFDFIGSEHSGGSYLPAGFDENGGFPGITDDQLLYLLHTGHLLQLGQNVDRQVTVGPYLNTYSPDVILLHIGTNENDKPNGTSTIEVEAILNQIDAFELSSGKEVTVFLSRIINRVPNQTYVNTFNNNVEMMALDRVNNPLNSAYPDKIVIVDMQDSANINYTISTNDLGPGDMYDWVHPNSKGYSKMAHRWFNSLKTILPKPPVITKQPQNQYTIEGSTTNFYIVVESEELLSFQWRKNGSNIFGANNSVLTLNNINLTDDGSTFSCKISNVNGTVYSNSAQLFVNSNLTRVQKGLLAEYDFEEAEGTIIHNKVDETGGLDLVIQSPQSTSWITNGISISDICNISTSSSVTDLNNSIMTTNEFSFEIWFSPSEFPNAELGRIITISESNEKRNFSLDQNIDSLIFKTRTSETDLNGMPKISFHASISQNNLEHLLISRNKDGTEKIYLNGVLNDVKTKNGDLSNWNNNYKLSIGNEFGVNKSWLGNIYLFAIYNRELNLVEVNHNFNMGEDGITDIRHDIFQLSHSLKLYQNYPNPFNPTTTLSFDLPKESKVLLNVYNLMGELVTNIVDDNLSMGRYNYYFDASELSSGFYIYSISTIDIEGNRFTSSKKMILMK